ncbi:RNA-directed DNA polymerase, eukaryota [Tanacetum coccineum]
MNLSVTRWNPLVPRKVNIFCWRMFLNRIPTRLILASRGIDIPNVLCPICGIHQEDTSHLFLKCYVASEIWKAIFAWLGSVPPDTAATSSNLTPGCLLEHVFQALLPSHD